MEEGKIPVEILKKIIYKNLGTLRNDVLVHSGIGEDCSIIDFGEQVAVLSSDPITVSDNKSGYLSVIINCNDIASCGANPIGILSTILLPVGTSEDKLKKIVDEINNAAIDNGIEVLGGHTEVTKSVNKPLISTTVIGIAKKDEYVKTGGARIDDDVIITKDIGIEGTCIIAYNYADLLAKEFSYDFVKNSQSFIRDISVIKEGLIASQNGANSMHDITEGGLLGAAYEIAEASNVGITIFDEKIPIRKETKKICEYFNINPLKLISSGSMLITAKSGEKIIEKLKKNKIKGTIIGKITDSDKYLIKNGEMINILPPESDEIYKLRK